MLNSMHSYKTKTSDLSVALLVEDIRFAKKLSEEFRAAGIFPFFYKTLDDFWGHIKIDTPDFALIDAKKVRENDVYLKNHPLIQSKALKCALWVTSQNDLDGNMSFIPELGYLFSNLDLSTQIRSLVLHGLTLINQDIRLKRSEDKYNHLNDQFGDLKDSLDSLKSKAKASTELKGLLKFARSSNLKSFSEKLDQLLSDWKGAEQFSIMSYDKTHEQLSCLSSSSHKKVTLPDLWPMNSSAGSIQGGDVKLALDLAYKYFNLDVVPLRFGKNRTQTDMIALVGMNSALTRDFDWSAFEMALNGFYLENQELKKNIESSPLKSLANLIDNITHLNEEDLIQKRIVKIDFNAFYQFLFEGRSKKFDFKNFYQTFSAQISETLDAFGTFKVLEGGQYFLMLDKEPLQKIYPALTRFVQDFAYFKFFADKKTFIPKEAKPSLKIINTNVKSVLAEFGTPVSKEQKIEKLTSKLRRDTKQITM